MFVFGKKSLSVIFKTVLQCIFIGGLTIFLSLPLCLKWYLEFSENYSEDYFLKTLILLYVSGVLALAVLYLSIRLLNNINKTTPFNIENPKILKTIGVCSLLIAAIYFIAIFVIKSVFTIILFMIFVMLGFMAVILSEVFKKAIEYKEENDLTV